jgi:serine/threonine protein phosphatase PrpC
MQIQHYIQASVDHLDRSEDAILITAVPGCAPAFAVIDGMGGHQHRTAEGALVTGAEAAQAVRAALLDKLADLPAEVSADEGGDGEARLLAAFEAAHGRLYEGLNQGESLPDHRRVGAVLTAALICEGGGRALIGQVGDTRAYLHNGEGLHQLSPDEDNIAFLIRAGVVSAEDGARVAAIINDYDGLHDPKPEGEMVINGQAHRLEEAWRWFLVGNIAMSIPGANVVMNALGIDPEPPRPAMVRAVLAPGATLLLCTDGVHKNLSVPEIRKYLEAGAPNADHARLLGEMAFARSRDRANRRSARDDISAIVAHF